MQEKKRKYFYDVGAKIFVKMQNFQLLLNKSVKVEWFFNEIFANYICKFLLFYKYCFQKSIRVTFGFTWEHDTSEDYGMMLYHRNRLIKAFERVGYQKQVCLPF